MLFLLVVVGPLLSFASAFACSFESTTDCNTLDTDKQCRALCELYSSTGGAAWINNSGWGEGSDPCSGAWYGVNCSSATPLTSISIRNNNAPGTLPSTVAWLSQLSSLTFADSALSGMSLSRLSKYRW